MKKLITIISMFFMLAGTALGHEEDIFLKYIMNDFEIAGIHKQNLKRRKDLRKKKIYEPTVYDQVLIQQRSNLLAETKGIEERIRRLNMLVKHWNTFQSPERGLENLDSLDRILRVKEMRYERKIETLRRRIKTLGEKIFWLEKDYLLWKLKNGKANEIDKMLLQTKYKK